MRFIGWILLVLVAAAWVASEVPVAEAELSAPCQATWRETADGWEPEQAVLGRPMAGPPALHPAVVVTLQTLLSVYLLVGLSAPQQGRTS